MGDDNSISKVKETIEVVNGIMKAAGDNPKVKEAASNLGDSAVIITKTIKNCLLPLAAINYSFDKAKNYFENKFSKDLSERVAKIPEENIIEPKSSIVGPAIQSLAFSHEELSLKELYLNLISGCMDSRKSDENHPSFVEIIRQLSSQEAEIIPSLLKSAEPHPIVEVRFSSVKVRGWSTIAKHLMPYRDDKTGEPVEDKNLPVYIDNWIRLGLVEVDYQTFLQDNARYEWVNERPEVVRLRKQFETEDRKITFANGIIRRTSYGLQFAKAVGIFDSI